MYRRKDERWAALFRNLRVVQKRCKMIARSAAPHLQSCRGQREMGNPVSLDSAKVRKQGQLLLTESNVIRGKDFHLMVSSGLTLTEPDTVGRNHVA